MTEEQIYELIKLLLKEQASRIKCYEEQYLATLKKIKAEIEHRIKINEEANNENT